MNEITDLDLGPAILAYLAKAQMSYRELHEATVAADPAGKGYTLSWLHRIAQGGEFARTATMKIFMEDVAAALGEEPTMFRQYREMLAAEEAARLVRERGYDEVMAALAGVDKKRRGARASASAQAAEAAARLRQSPAKRKGTRRAGDAADEAL